MPTLPLSLSVAAALDKSKLAGGDAWLALVKITWPDGSLLRLVRNVDDVVFDTGDGSGPQTFTAFAWDFAELNETADGSIPSWAVKVSNVSGVIESLLQIYGGGVGGNIVVYVVQASRLKREPDLELSFDITGCQADSKWVTFTLGAESPFRIQFGRHNYTADNCCWRYKGPQCGYTGPLPTCSYRLGDANGCRAHANQLRFGGFPGIDSNGLRVVSK